MVWRVTIKEVTQDDDFVYQVVVEEPLDAYKSYQITYEGTEYKVVMPSVYSTKEFEEEYTYDGDDLGATWTKDSTAWHHRTAVSVNLYESGTEGTDDLSNPFQ